MIVYRYCITDYDGEILFLQVSCSTAAIPDRATLESCYADNLDWWESCGEFFIRPKEFFDNTHIHPIENIAVLQFHAKAPKGTSQEIFDASGDFLDFTQPGLELAKHIYRKLLKEAS